MYPSAFLSTLSLRRATHGNTSFNLMIQHFYPRSPCGERRRPIFFGQAEQNFYPRSPCGERPNLRRNQHQRKQISIHALLAESDALDISERREERISIHALLAESDTWARGSRATYVEFLSTLSLRRATMGTPPLI